MSGTVYLIHFKTKFRHAKHYIGFCEEGNLESRMQRHRSGDGAKLLRAVVKEGIEFDVARTWQGDRDFERRLKKRKNASRLCPVCVGGEVAGA